MFSTNHRAACQSGYFAWLFQRSRSNHLTSTLKVFRPPYCKNKSTKHSLIGLKIEESSENEEETLEKKEMVKTIGLL